MKAIACEDKKHWENAMLEEVQNMYSHQVWELVPRPVNAKVVKSKWVFKISNDQENKTYKARLVAMGYNQIPGRDYNESFSPVSKNATLRTILSMAAIKDSVIKLFDVKAAYLNGNIENTIFMKQPAGFVQDRNKVCKLNKSIYGLPQSGRSCYEKFSQVLHDCGLEKLNLILAYLNGRLKTNTSIFINKLRHHLEIKDVTCKGMFLGIKIIQDKEGISLQQSHYVQQILQKYGMETYKEVPTPGSKEINLDNHIEDDNCDQHTYQEALGMLMFLAVNTRPDIAYITSKLSQYSRQPKQMHWTAIKRVMRYLRGTIDLGVKFERGKTGILKGYNDASWLTTHDGKSYGGYVLKLGEATIDWKSSKQPLVALSTMEAEMIAACESCCQIKWIINLLQELEEWNFMEKPTAIYTDKDICLLFKPSQDLEADIFTKDLSQDPDEETPGEPQHRGNIDKKDYCVFSEKQDEVLKHFDIYRATVEGQTGNKIKVLRSDNGLEFCNRDFQDKLQKLGIKHERTNVYSPQMNGVAERVNRTLLDMARACLHSANLPQRFWAEAVNTAAYIKNKCYNSALKDKVPDGLWLERNPSVRHLKAFGCLAYSHIPRERRRKLDHRACRCILVGYSTQTRGYRLWCPESQKVIETKHFRFDESKIGLEWTKIVEETEPERYNHVWLEPETNYDNDIENELPNNLDSVGVEDALPQPSTSKNIVRNPYGRKGKPRVELNFLDVTEPQSFEEAVHSPETVYWRKAMEDELRVLQERGTWELSTLPPGKKPISSRWVYKVKTNESGNVERFKARLVARGFSQKQGIDFQETYAPVINLAVIRVLITLSLNMKWYNRHLDVDNAYLYGDLEEKERMKVIPYRELIGSLLYLANCTRPDLMFSVTRLAQFASNPGRRH
ncbi:hypothetical protein LAZ67_6001387 [Cordylochernes scorpioides]|uniref:Integrase catalytic domain-containing protein n=1 Tax=Cordylochernes scorpioides TaxID=51811 RepID=A0ABY6KJ59_9ARAC|nr:hypothetical protein LAZ67_6001387 [Cordylochernes scorpioides]